MEFNELIVKHYRGETIKYGFIFGNEKIVFIKSGAGGDVYGYSNKYLHMAHRAHEKLGATVICSSNPDVLHEDIDEEMIRWAANEVGAEDCEIYFVGASDGAYKNLTLAKRFSETKKYLGINASFITLSGLEARLNALPKVEKILVYGTEDYEYNRVFPALRESTCENLKTIFIKEVDHNFTDWLRRFENLIDMLEDDSPQKAITFGRYWEGTGMENIPIEWLVLEETDKRLLLISKQSVVSKAFSNGAENWADSDIRKWLNYEFVRLAFDDNERMSILEETVITEYDLDSLSIPILEENTADKVFLLDEDGFNRYFAIRKSGIAEQSKYAVDTLAEKWKFDNSWWLRNGGEYGYRPLLVTEDGLRNRGCAAWLIAGIRPAMYIKKNFFE